MFGPEVRTLLKISEKEYPPYKSLGDEFKERRMQKKLPLNVIATLTGIDHGNLSRIEHSREIPRFINTIKLSRLYCTDLNDFLSILKNAEMPINLRLQEWLLGDEYIASDNETFREKLKAYRISRNLLQPVVAARAGINKSIVARFESGKSYNITMASAVSIINGIGLTENQVSDLFSPLFLKQKQKSLLDVSTPQEIYQTSNIK